MLRFDNADLPPGADEHMDAEELAFLAELNQANPAGLAEADLGRFPAFTSWPQWTSDWYWSPTEDLGRSIEPETPHAVPCAACGTTKGSKHSKANFYVRYSGEPYGVAGKICSTCRSREYQKAKKAAAGSKPRKPLSRQPSDNTLVLPSSKHVAATIQAIRREHEDDGIKPREGLTEVERQQLEWAALALSSRQEAAASRRSRYRWSPLVTEPTPAPRCSSLRA